MNNYLKTTDKIEVPNYPYGYNKRTTAYFSLEFKAGKGFRSMFQTINPATGLFNKPKASTYSYVLLMYKNEDGHIKNHSLDFYGDEGMARDIAFMFTHFDLFTTEQIKSIALTIIALLKADVYAKVVYTGADKDKILPLYEVAMTQAVQIAKTGDNLFDKVIIDYAAVKALEVPDYKPFKTTTYTIN